MGGGGGGGSETPYIQHMFDINNNTDKLYEETAQIFHHNVEKLLF